MLVFAQCSRQKERQVQRSFYFWKSVYKPTAFELQAARDLSVKKLYIKFFDISWDDAKQKASPVAHINFPVQPRFSEIVPVCFITNQTIEKTEAAHIDSLAERILFLTRDIIAVNQLQGIKELQIDCDWTGSTRDKYFQLLKTIKAGMGKWVLSATIRLHQLKFSTRIGVPPVDRGLLMCYNMGNLTNPKTENSILDSRELKKYISHVEGYRLPLDYALPIFDWYAWFRNDKFRGLVRSASLSQPFKNRKMESDTTINGYHFKKGDWLRYENSREIKYCAELLEKQISSTNFSVVLFHLDEQGLRKYSLHELEDIFGSFH